MKIIFRMVLIHTLFVKGVVVKRTVNANGSTEALVHVTDSGAPCHFLHKVGSGLC